MTTQCPELATKPAASTDLHAIEEELQLRNRIDLRRRLDRLINDPHSPSQEILQLLAAAEKAQYRDRELALAERRCEIRLRTIALQEAKMALIQSSSSGSSEAQPSEKVPRTKPPAKKSPKSPKETPEAVSPESTAEAAAVPRPEQVPVPAARTSPTTAELQAMEWDLRSVFDFGDLRPFEFCTGSQMIRFPDRTSLPARPNFPVGVTATDGLSRNDEYVVLPHVLPAGFVRSESKAKAKTDAGAKAEKAVREKMQPRLKDGVIDWFSFVRPLSTGVWPENTMLPATWQYGDPVPGGWDEQTA